MLHSDRKYMSIKDNPVWSWSCKMACETTTKWIAVDLIEKLNIVDYQ